MESSIKLRNTLNNNIIFPKFNLKDISYIDKNIKLFIPK